MIIDVVSSAAPVLIELEEEEDGVKGVGEAELDTIALLLKDDFFLLIVEKDEFCTGTDCAASIADDEEEDPISPLPPPVLGV